MPKRTTVSTFFQVLRMIVFASLHSIWIHVPYLRECCDVDLRNRSFSTQSSNCKCDFNGLSTFYLAHRRSIISRPRRGQIANAYTHLQTCLRDRDETETETRPRPEKNSHTVYLGQPKTAVLPEIPDALKSKPWRKKQVPSSKME